MNRFRLVLPMLAVTLLGFGQPGSGIKPWQDISPVREAYVNLLHQIQLGMAMADVRPGGRFSGRTIFEDRKIVAAQHHWLDMVQANGPMASGDDGAYFGQLDLYTRLPMVYRVGGSYSAFPSSPAEIPASKRLTFDVPKMLDRIKATATAPDHPAAELVLKENDGLRKDLLAEREVVNKLVATANKLALQVSELSRRPAERLTPDAGDAMQRRMEAEEMRRELEEQTKELRRIRKNLENIGW